MTTHELAQKLLKLEDKPIEFWTITDDSDWFGVDQTHTKEFCIDNEGKYYCLYPDRG